MTSFIKMSGCGNDFIALVEPVEAPAEGAIRAWCRRGISLGADGVFTLHRLRPQAVEMRYWNSDGGEAALCLNGTRCAAQLAFQLGWSSDRVTVRTGAGELAARRLASGAVAVEAPLPEPPSKTTLVTPDGAFTGWLARVGVPHLVCFRDQPVESVPLDDWSPALRRHRDLGPEGANVDFVEMRGRHDLTIRSFERGIEGETLACGTGVLATAAAALAAGLAELPIRALTRGGFTLEVLGETDDAKVKRWELAGEARLVAEGTLLPGAC
ncbi:MAG TPA: diaminopimelate epimerase [Thermoanaerobaculia bacterium]|jgi:diaminopimelate epimerase|nr:diaminopimelate epimerase [Thermoanaerobaculia bacterium]